MLDKLKKLKEIIPVSSDGVIMSLVDELIELEQERIRKQLAKDNKCLNGYNSCMKVLKSKTTKTRPVLQKAKELKDGKIVFTDSYQLYMLNDNRYNLPLHDNSVNYPNIEPLIPNTFNWEIVDLPELLFVKFAIEDKVNLRVGESIVDPKLVLNAYSILGNKLTCYWYSVNKPLKLINDKGEIGVILPLRKSEV